MYILGTLYDFQNRLHQGATDNDSLTGYLAEGRTYLQSGLVLDNISGQWEKEARLAAYRFANDSGMLVTQQF